MDEQVTTEVADLVAESIHRWRGEIAELLRSDVAPEIREDLEAARWALELAASTRLGR